MLFRPLLPAEISVAEMLPAHADPETLHADERAVIQRAVEKRRLEYAAGRHLAKSLLRDVGSPLDALLSDKDRVPVWPQGVHGSITHCNSLCAVAVAHADRYGGVGIDVEPAQPLREELLKMILRPRERETLSLLPPSLRPLGGILVFSIKEAVYKAIYPQQRHFLDFQEVELTWTGADELTGEGSFEAEVLVPAAVVPGLPRIAGRYRVAEGHVASTVVLPLMGRL